MSMTSCLCCNRSTRPHRHIIARGTPDSGNRHLVQTIYQRSDGGFEVEGAEGPGSVTAINESPAAYAAKTSHLGWKWSSELHALEFLRLAREQHTAKGNQP